jgi:N-acetylneuraminic acid mutarotase
MLRVACRMLSVGWLCAVNSFPKGSQNYLATAAAGNSVYVLDHHNGPSTSSHKYSAAADVWTTIRRIPTYRAGTEHAASAASVGNRIYVMGGLASISGAKNEVYDTQTDTWATKAALPVGRAGAAVGVWSNRIYLVAGYGLPLMLSSMHVYTPSADAWTSGASRSDLCFCGSSSDRRGFCACCAAFHHPIAAFCFAFCAGSLRPAIACQVRACPPRGSLWPARSSATCCTLRAARSPQRR